MAIHHATRTFLRALCLIACVSSFARIAAKQQTQSGPVTPATVGQEMFREYCASCHGADGRGNGPAAAALKNKPSDLTQLSKRNRGKFPEATVENAIEGNAFIIAHGSREMPVWGAAFRNVNRDEMLVKMKVHNLAAYIESIQQR